MVLGINEPQAYIGVSFFFTLVENFINPDLSKYSVPLRPDV